MKIKKILLPVVTDNFEGTIEFYEKITGEEVALSASHDGYKLSLIDQFVILTAIDNTDAVAMPRIVNAIFLVDDLLYFWDILEKESKKIIIPVNRVSTGIRFIVEQNDGKIIEYLQLNEN